MPVQMTSAQTPAFVLEKGDLRFTFHPSGDLYEALGSGFMLNQVLTGPTEGALNNIYLRIHREEGLAIYPLIGLQSKSLISRSGNRISWRGEAGGTNYEVSFMLSGRGVWFWDVQLHSGGTFLAADVVYGQDIGLASPAAVRSNEAYLSQYLDHSVYADPDKGWIVCTRQNQPQSGQFPYLQQGSLTGAEAYATDGFQFFGLSYKDTHRPEALEQPSLPSEVYQYEFAYAALQSGRMNLAKGGRAVFYGLFRDDHPQAVTEAEFQDVLADAWEEVQREAGSAEATEFNSVPARSADLGVPVYSQPLTQEQVETRYPHRLQEEREDGELLSFFTPTYEHVVLKAKELRTERPHGHILMSGAPDRAGAEVLTSTAYMYGVFHSQLVVGNTSYNKLISNTRNALNALKTSGQRIYAEVDGKYRMLAMPSLFEIGFNYATWIYVLEDDVIRVTSYTTADRPEAVLELVSERQQNRKFLITTQVTMSEREFEVPYEYERAGNSVVFRAADGTLASNTYAQLRYRMTLTGAEASAHDERRLVPSIQPGIAPLYVIETTATSAWQLRIDGGLDGLQEERAVPSLEASAAQYRQDMAARMNGFALSHPDDSPGVERLNILAWWYTHNMRVHFAVPHGLEQYGGAAWGTRDVCQGPAEYFLAVQHYEAVQDIIRTVYSHQYEDDGAWPQWFMFDQYYRIQQDESHGDIIVWPLKLLGDYIAATGDFAILEEELPFTQREAHDFTKQTYTLLEHVQKQIGYIRSHFLHDTHLSSYGDGDWDDTLQPASASLRTYMVSSWTVALTYQAMLQFGRLLAEGDGAANERRIRFGSEAIRMAESIREDFHRYMQPDAVIPGFLYMEEANRPEKLLHPEDTRTGIQYRLLPMTRSMIAELLTPEQAQRHYELIKRELQFPDGVRLMNRPAAYEGGVSTRFKRAEQASNFGREIGLQYVHAHIRFIEAMAKLGHAEEAWHALQVINPVGLREVVPNAELRQSNSYFSSSDGKFATRAEAANRFEELRSGSAPVKGGWRIYSSGPGIYMNQLISNFLGIRHAAGELLLDPILPEELDGLTLRYAIGGRPVRIQYRIGGQAIKRITLNGSELALERIPNPYRSTGARVELASLDGYWLEDSSAVNELIIET
ncbi:cellobiose phosphorylase [Paenibacillus phyllosphaerae]|uniref:Cellobiose phosphorylase n=1 Tax=Paenibacillus phyllosphaerae TaxID=274593 RepID=A0A7W5B1C2_9BACL|nr:cellobiose phosphorylase [Paenibacillus phyllosphaerae]MBB3112582.1 cellobiose phosphorylase [Paenibacillus phyllosphaerae]